MRLAEGRQNLFDCLIGLALEKQCAFCDTVVGPPGEWKWFEKNEKFWVEIPSTGTFEAQYLGTEPSETNTWLYSWANKSIPEAATKAAYAFSKNFAHDPVLSAPYSPLNQVNGDYLGVIATQKLDASVYLTVPNVTNTGTFFLLIFDVPMINLNPTPFLRIATVLDLIGSSAQVKNHRLAMRSYLQAKNFNVTNASDTDQSNEIFTHTSGRHITIEENQHTTSSGKVVYTIRRKFDFSHQDNPAPAIGSQLDDLVRPLSRVAPNFVDYHAG